ncbi:PLP-dependent transferase [Gymnopus androsaceus JB14]|uniref:PLP-dependent transferase n=1 Tax=Gymnopus androsaceus JB14 TaxID=1447944 RepID=A0A6A4HDV7_9AGAR|nr:PLP-dependent transferase [Gymnopus androsaceus JB14]
MPCLPGYDQDLHQAVSAWFLGPRAENFGYLQMVLSTILAKQDRSRKEYYPDDPDFITKDVQTSSAFQNQMKKLSIGVRALAYQLAEHHVLFWSPRYNGHMTNDTTLPGIAGYLTGMLFNPNNVAAEASLLTTWLEMKVGQEFCEMVGYNIDPGNKDEPQGWGHITCDGSVANLESIWAGKTSGHHSLRLLLAMERGSLGFLLDKLEVQTCQGQSKLLRDFTTWELLNISPLEILAIPDRLYSKYNISSTFLQNALSPYLIQSIGKDASMFEQRFGREYINRMAYVTSAAKHYSWPKGAAVTGIGSENLISIRVNDGAHMDIVHLEEELNKCLYANPPRAIYAVVAIIGSTEHGACDPLADIVRLRKQFRKKGLTFVLHANGAWGTYFFTTLKKIEIHGELGNFVPSIALKPKTKESLQNLHECDLITVDPHKSGYIQYPAGGLLYRDQRMRYLITWTSPVVNRQGEESIGVYGIEGSKPGASAVATWLSHQVIGLNAQGYGALLGEAIFGCTMMYAYLSTMSTQSTSYIVTPLNLLPAEVPLNSTNAKVEEQKTMTLIRQMGSDLSINAFAINFKLDGQPNRDVVCGNDLNRRIFERLSIVSPTQTLKDKPLFLTSTVFSQKNYGSCLRTYKRRLGLDASSNLDLYSLINVVMSPFPTENEFTAKIIEALGEVIKEEAETSVSWNTVSPDFHGFVMQGTDRLYLVHFPMFNMASHHYQLIITGELPPAEMEKYVKAREENPGQLYTLANVKKEELSTLLKSRRFKARVDKGIPSTPGSTPLIEEVELANIEIIVNRQIDSTHLENSYLASSVPFFLYGTGKQLHIDHVLLASPNIQLNADQVKNVPEQSMQPFPANATIQLNNQFFFKPGSQFEVVLLKGLEGEPLGRGGLALGDFTFFDNNDINMFPVAQNHIDKPKAPNSGNPAKSIKWADLIVGLFVTIRVAVLIFLLGFYHKQDSRTGFKLPRNVCRNSEWSLCVLYLQRRDIIGSSKEQ